MNRRKYQGRPPVGSQDALEVTKYVYEFCPSYEKKQVARAYLTFMPTYLQSIVKCRTPLRAKKLTPTL